MKSEKDLFVLLKNPKFLEYIKNMSLDVRELKQIKLYIKELKSERKLPNSQVWPTKMGP